MAVVHSFDGIGCCYLRDKAGPALEPEPGYGLVPEPVPELVPAAAGHGPWPPDGSAPAVAAVPAAAIGVAAGAVAIAAAEVSAAAVSYCSSMPDFAAGAVAAGGSIHASETWHYVDTPRPLQDTPLQIQPAHRHRPSYSSAT